MKLGKTQYLKISEQNYSGLFLEDENGERAFLSKVFEGPYKDAKNWHKEMQALAKEKGVAADIYFYYTTCPKCAKKWGKNYVVGMLKIK